MWANSIGSSGYRGIFRYRFIAHLCTAITIDKNLHPRLLALPVYTVIFVLLSVMITMPSSDACTVWPRHDDWNHIHSSPATPDTPLPSPHEQVIQAPGRQSDDNRPTGRMPALYWKAIPFIRSSWSPEVRKLPPGEREPQPEVEAARTRFGCPKSRMINEGTSSLTVVYGHPEHLDTSSHQSWAQMLEKSR